MRSLSRWLAIRLIMATQSREPDMVCGFPDAVPYYTGWRLFGLFGFQLVLLHLQSPAYQRTSAVLRWTLMGWYRAEVQESPRRVVLRDEGGFSRGSELVDLPERSSAWVLAVQRR